MGTKRGPRAYPPHWAMLVRLAFTSVGLGLIVAHEVRFHRREAALGGPTGDLAFTVAIVFVMVGLPFVLYLFGVRTAAGSVAIGALLLVTLVGTYLWISYVIDIDDGMEGLWIPFNVWIVTIVSLLVERQRLLPKYRQDPASDPVIRRLGPSRGGSL